MISQAVSRLFLFLTKFRIVFQSFLLSETSLSHRLPRPLMENTL